MGPNAQSTVVTENVLWPWSGRRVWWTLDGEAAVERIGPTVGMALESFACPAISIVMEDPSRRHVPEDARSFVVPERDYGLSIEERRERRRWADQMQESSLGWRLDECLTKLDHGEWFLRFLARASLRQRYPNDPRSIQAYVDALAREDFPHTREGIARVLGFWPGGTGVERGRIAWKETTSPRSGRDAIDALRAQTLKMAKPPSVGAVAEEWLFIYLSKLNGDPVDSAKVKADGLKAGQSVRNLNRAATSLGVTMVNLPVTPRRTTWALQS